MEETNQNSQTYQDFNSDIYKPNNEKDLQEIIKYCFKNNLPIEIIGKGTKSLIGKKLQCAKTLDMSNISGIIVIISSLVLTVIFWLLARGLI